MVLDDSWGIAEIGMLNEATAALTPTWTPLQDSRPQVPMTWPQ